MVVAKASWAVCDIRGLRPFNAEKRGQMASSIKVESNYELFIDFGGRETSQRVFAETEAVAVAEFSREADGDGRRVVRTKRTGDVRVTMGNPWETGMSATLTIGMELDRVERFRSSVENSAEEAVFVIGWLRQSSKTDYNWRGEMSVAHRIDFTMPREVFEVKGKELALRWWQVQDRQEEQRVFKSAEFTYDAESATMRMTWERYYS